jgi:hypothetical protein
VNGKSKNEEGERRSGLSQDTVMASAWRNKRASFGIIIIPFKI